KWDVDRAERFFLSVPAVPARRRSLSAFPNHVCPPTLCSRRVPGGIQGAAPGSFTDSVFRTRNNLDLPRFSLVGASRGKWCQFIFRLPALSRGISLATMGRQLRPIAAGLVYHALNRGNNREVVFSDTADYLAFLQALAQTQQRYPFRLYAYCLMPNH